MNIQKEFGNAFANAVDFLLFTYFRLTRESEKGECIKAAIAKAYEDATNQGAFNAVVSKEWKSKFDGIKDKCCSIISEKLDDLLSSKSDVEFDEKHKNLCNDIVYAYKNIKRKNSDEPAFTYGNAQKWVNMTFKNLYVICGIIQVFDTTDDNMKAFRKQILETEKFFHTPIDSYIIDTLWCKEGIKLPYIPKEKMNEQGLPIYSKNWKDHKKGNVVSKYDEKRVVPWSKWDEEYYTEFHESLKKSSVTDGKSEIVWEGPVWIEIAKKRNK